MMRKKFREEGDKKFLKEVSKHEKDACGVWPSASKNKRQRGKNVQK